MLRRFKSFWFQVLGDLVRGFRSSSLERQSDHCPRCKELEEKIETLERLALLDPLTGLYNRNGLANRSQGLARLWERQRQNSAARLSVIAIDFDFFKEINDQLGHDGGDFVLKLFGKTALQAVRGDDVVARMGGDEFIFLLPETTAEQAYKAAEHIRAALRKELAPKLPKALAQKFSCSAGIAEVTSEEFVTYNLALESGLKRADVALYQAKYQRDHQVIWLEEAPERK